MRGVQFNAIESPFLALAGGVGKGGDNLVDHQLGHGDRHHAKHRAGLVGSGPRRRTVHRQRVVATVPDLLEHLHAQRLQPAHHAAVALGMRGIEGIERHRRGRMHADDLEDGEPHAALGAAGVEFRQVVEGMQRESRAVRGARHAIAHFHRADADRRQNMGQRHRCTS